MNNSALLATYIRQQMDLGMSDPILEQGRSFLLALEAPALASVPVFTASRTVLKGASLPATAVKLSVPPPSSGSSPLSRLNKLPLIKKTSFTTKASPPVAPDLSLPIDGPLSFEQKRAVFKELFIAQCSKCHLAGTRKKFVFGAGNVDARLLIIGEAPGHEEDQQGLPFVGPAGKMLTEMLSEVSIDRKKDVFITNILKCRPPGNRNPESAEILACLPLLRRQIAVIRPKFLLLLGRIAAHSLLEGADSIVKMRGKSYVYEGIPAMVTYHPAAILRSPEYRRPAEEDMQKIATMLKESEHNGAS